MIGLSETIRLRLLTGALLAEFTSACLIWAMWHRVAQFAPSENHFSEVSDWILSGILVNLIGLVLACFGNGWNRMAALIVGVLLLLVWLSFGMGA